MDFTLLDHHLNEQFKQISRRIHRLQSGGTIDSLRDVGANTENQIGASFVSLKSLAENYPTNEKLSLLLWNRKKREEQIIACFLFPENLNREIITQLIPQSISFEIAEYFGSVFLTKHTELREIVESWSCSPEPFQQIAALTATARHLMIHKQDSHLTREFLLQIANKIYIEKYVQLVAERYRFKF